MGKKKNKQFWVSYIAPVIGVTLVLVVLGALGQFLIYAFQLGQHFKETVEINIYIKENVADSEKNRLMNKVKTISLLKSFQFVTKEEALAIFMREEGAEDPVALLGYNPFPESIKVTLKKDALQENYIIQIKTYFEKDPIVKGVEYSQNLLKLLLINLKRISLLLTIIAIIFIITSILLIDNTIKLKMYSDRFLIKTMQLVGAEFSFILKPFLKKAIYLGLLCSSMAVVFLFAGGFYLQKIIPEIRTLENWDYTIILYIFLFLTGLLICFLSTYSSVKKYVKTSITDLY
ncbi:MAG: cell division protein FtsX [Chitinophagaceae bacterium]